MGTSSHTILGNSVTTCWLASDLGDAFPFICGPVHGIDARGQARDKISRKFQNKRRKIEDPEVARRKARVDQRSESVIFEGLTAYHPPPTSSTTQAKCLANEMKEAGAGKEHHYLSLTYADRRNFFGVAEALQRYAET